MLWVQLCEECLVEQTVEHVLLHYELYDVEMERLAGRLDGAEVWLGWFGFMGRWVGGAGWVDFLRAQG